MNYWFQFSTKVGPEKPTGTLSYFLYCYSLLNKVKVSNKITVKISRNPEIAFGHTSQSFLPGTLTKNNSASELTINKIELKCLSPLQNENEYLML